MEYIFRTITSNSYHFTCDELKYLSTSKEVIKEMGEPIIVSDNQKWIFAYIDDILVGFSCYKEDKILYFYTLPAYRNRGIFNLLYNELPNDINWNVIASNNSLPIFIKKGFTVIKNYKNCHKLKLKTI